MEPTPPAVEAQSLNHLTTRGPFSIYFVSSLSLLVQGTEATHTGQRCPIPCSHPALPVRRFNLPTFFLRKQFTDTSTQKLHVEST